MIRRMCKQSKLDKAKAFVDKYHRGQTLKYTNLPYSNHLYEVYELLYKIKAEEDVQIGGLLHDLLEDTSATEECIEKEFGKLVLSLVKEVTDVSRPEDGNRKIRKTLDLNHIALASKEGKTIKLADMISNSKSILQHDPSFARLYLREMESLLSVVKEGDSQLYWEASRIINNGIEVLEEN
jgi:(p)ppGpp synthase/HD superfamily hydrolase